MVRGLSPSQRRPETGRRRRAFIRRDRPPGGFQPREKLAFFLLDPHPKMPNFPLTRIEAGDISAYIASLRK